MGAEAGDAALRVARGVAEHVAVLLPDEHLVAGRAELREGRRHVVGDRAEVLGDQPGPGGGGALDHRLDHALAVAALGGLVGRVEAGRDELAFVIAAGVVGAHAGAKEADQVVDAEAVVELAAVAGAAAQPREVVAGHHGPVVRRQAPVLAVLVELVGGAADRHVEAKLLALGPHVGAVAVDHEGQVAHDLDTVLAQDLARVGPLGVRQPLRVPEIEDRVREPRGGLAQGRGIAVTQGGRPVPPRGAAAVIFDRPVEGVVREPAGVRVLEGAEAAGAWARLAGGRELVLVEHLEAGDQGPALDLADALVVDAGGLAQGLELGGAVVAEGLVVAERSQVVDGGEGDVHRVDAEGREGAVGGAVAAGDLVDREDLQQRHAGRREQAGGRRQVADLADAPRARGAQREQRHGDADDPTR